MAADESRAWVRDFGRVWPRLIRERQSRYKKMDASNKRPERLLSLVTLLLNSRRPVSFAKIRGLMPEYGVGSEQTALRKFERDKASLVEDLGIPIRYVEIDTEEEADSSSPSGGYVLDKQSYYLPSLSLSSDELVALYVAGAASRAMDGFPWAIEVTRALEKIRFASSNGETEELCDLPLAVKPSRERNEKAGRTLALIRDAVARKKRVHLAYRGLWRDELTHREVDPFGLFLRDGLWCLQAYCHLRDEQRTFDIDRIESLKVNPNAPRKPDFDPPADLDLAALARLRPWSYPVGEPVLAVVLLEQRLAFFAKSMFGEDAKVSWKPDKRALVEVSVTNSEAFIEHVLGLRDGATLLGPPALRDELLARLDQIVSSLQRS